MLDIQSIKQNKAEALREIADELLTIKPLQQKRFVFNTSQIDPENTQNELIENVSEWVGSDNFIYVYFLRLLGNTDPSIVHKAFSEAKKQKVGQRAYPRLNPESRCLYVGSSRNFVQRLKEHLGYGYKQTYAMQMVYWATSLELDVELCCMRLHSNISSAVLQAFEDGIWESLKPMLGRRGPK